MAGTPKCRPSHAAPLERRLVKGGNGEGDDCHRGGKREDAQRTRGATRAQRRGGKRGAAQRARGATRAQRAQDGAHLETRHRSGEATIVARAPAGGGQRPADAAVEGDNEEAGGRGDTYVGMRNGKNDKWCDVSRVGVGWCWMVCCAGHR